MLSLIVSSLKVEVLTVIEKRRKKFGLLAVVLLGMISLAACGNEEVNLFPETIEMAIEIAELQTTTTVPGITIALVDAESGFTWTAGFGYADTLTERLVTADTIFPIASVSKPVTAIAVMQLVEQGLIDLDNPITTYLPEFSMLPGSTGANYENITVRMLLNHTAGFPLFLDFRDPELNALLTGFHEFDLDYSWLNQLLVHLPEQAPFFEGGTNIHYSSAGIDLLGAIIGAVLDYDYYFEGFIYQTHENIFSRLDMSNSFFLSPEEMLLNYAMPYTGRAIQMDIIRDSGMVDSPNGMESTANDMAILMHAILNDTRAGTGQLLEQDSFLQMFDFNEDFNVFINGRRSVGLGFMHRTDSSGVSFIGHSGTTFFHFSEMVFDLESGIGVFVSTNSSSGGGLAPWLAEEVLRGAIEEKAGD